MAKKKKKKGAISAKKLQKRSFVSLLIDHQRKP